MSDRHTIKAIAPTETDVRARLPDPLAPMADIAWNLWWTWDGDAQALFERLEPGAWSDCTNNPVRLLRTVDERALERAAADGAFVEKLRATHRRFRQYLESEGPMSGEIRRRFADNPARIAYFCAEYGLASCFQIYCGGLGLLAGDHLKSASDLGLPLVAVGLLYRHGYFHQRLDHDGRQYELMPDIEPELQPLRRIETDDGPLRVCVELPGREVWAAVWRCDVGRIPLYLLDTALPENAEEDREITHSLYLGDSHVRIRQEVVLGIGGVRALEALGEHATVFHLNEGHSAFLALERIARLRTALEVTFDQAREAAAPAHVFTTHTPVPAGIDRFPADMASEYLRHYHAGLALDEEAILALGREDVADKSEPFSMAVLAIRTSKWCNGVSALHGRVARRMWRRIWPGVPEDHVPIGHITNGVHTATWVGPEMAALFDEFLGDRWRAEPQNPDAWRGVENIPDDRFWAARCAQRERLIDFCRARARKRLLEEQFPPEEAERRARILDPDVLTIGFARRFAPYKRATLLLRDPARLLRLLADKSGVQILIAGKAHPADGIGKSFISDIFQFARREGVEHRLVFLEDYDIDVAAQMVRGCDVWLNNPVRGLEASGTSGMKAACNGVLNVSILDGWWDEAFAPELGFAVPAMDGWDELEASERDERRDDFESRAVFETIESSVLPEFHLRRGDGPPAKWIARAKRCIGALAPRFSTHRMVEQYARELYLPGHEAASRLSADRISGAREVSNGIDRLRAHWRDVRIDAVRAPDSGRVEASVRLGALDPREVRVQVGVTPDTHLDHASLHEPIDMRHRGRRDDGSHRYEADASSIVSAAHATGGLWVRVIPGDTRLVTPFVPGLITSRRVVEPDTGPSMLSGAAKGAAGG